MALTLRENICNARRLPRDHDLLIARAELLSAKDRGLIEAIFLRGQTVVSVAHMMGINPRKVSNRLRRLSEHLASRRFLDAARALRYLRGREATLARLRFCAGMTERRLAEKFGVSPHVIRRRLDRIGAKIALVRQMQGVQADCESVGSTDRPARG